ncbi:hypothetical protein L5G32_09440 [Gordonia sp. HY002]|uniref:hypothetical protein n=1 Tax=Gordonia zhenghanii TaxID=2911516 RepID=UPI001F3FE2BE|nr:hypothetical protein [Gordonia zhenghanii]MCF8570489.1 hypothetical protein [Gordonia zhenghanii]
MTDPSKVLAHLHDARLAHYRRHCSDDTEVLNLYVWNVDVASSLSALLGIAEVSIRHAIDTKLRSYANDIAGTTKWIEKLDELPDLMDAFNTTRRNLYKAADESRKTRPVHHPRHGVTINHDDLVAHIMFGTWGQLLPERFRSDRLDPQGRPVQDQDNLAARRRLWRESLHAGFPNMKNDPRGFNTGNKVRDLRRLRNRVSHMDSLLYVDIEHVHDRVLMPLLNSISFDLRDWAMEQSRVHDVLRRRP